jgi:hypothetical protein
MSEQKTPPEPFDRTYFVRSQGRRIRITTAADDPWEYDLHYTSAGEPLEGDEVVEDLVAFDQVLDKLRIQDLTPGTEFVNVIWRALRLDRVHKNKPINNIERRRRVDAPSK